MVVPNTDELIIAPRTCEFNSMLITCHVLCSEKWNERSLTTVSGLVREHTNRDDLPEPGRIPTQGRRQIKGVAELLWLWLAAVHAGSQGQHSRIPMPTVHNDIQWRYGSGKQWYSSIEEGGYYYRQTLWNASESLPGRVRDYY